MPLTNGENFAGYTIVRLLGSGGMGEVYLAQHPSLRRREALKVLPVTMSANREFRERLKREANIAATLRHPHIVGVHNQGECNGQLWIAMDYIDGIDAAQLLRQKYPAGMPIDLVMRITSAVASALDYAHKHKKEVLHRDVKPANIIVADLDTEDPRILLADFGIARSLDDTSGITTTNTTVATVAYAAPEQLMGKHLDGRSDQYALAITAYQLLTGLLPFEHSNQAVIISHHLNASPPPLSRLRPELGDLDPILAIALSKEPGERFSTCSDFAHSLASARAKGGTPDTSSRPTVARKRSPSATKKLSANLPPKPIEVHEPRPRWPVIASTLAMVILLAAVAVVFVVGPWEHDRASNGTTTAPTAPSSSITFDGMRDFVTGYYRDLPAHPMGAWAKLDAYCQEQTGLNEFVDFWATVQSVELVSVNPRDATSVVARLRYVRQDGQTDTEDRWLSVDLVNGAILLHESGRIGSVSGTPPPSPPSFAPKAIDEVLLTAAQLSKLLGADVTDAPGAAGGGAIELSLNASSYGTSDHSGQVTPRACVGVVFTAEHEVYATNEPAAIKTQTFGHVYGSSSNGPHLIEQSAAVFISAAQAQAFLTSSQAQWETCAKGEVDATLGFENGAGYTLGGVERVGDLITVSMATNGGLNGPDACQQALGVRENVVVEARSCEIPVVTDTYDPTRGWTKDPGWASPYAQRVAEAMLDHVTP